MILIISPETSKKWVGTLRPQNDHLPIKRGTRRSEILNTRLLLSVRRKQHLVIPNDQAQFQ